MLELGESWRGGIADGPVKRVAPGGDPSLFTTLLTDRLQVTAEAPVDLYILEADHSLRVESVVLVGHGSVHLPGLRPGVAIELEHELGPLHFRQGVGLLVWASLALAVRATVKESRWLEGAEYLLERVVGRGSAKLVLRYDRFT